MHVSDSRFSRNLGFISEAEQQKLIDSTVAIAGAGGDGGLLAEQLARMGVGSIRLADPESFELENINRQAGATTKTIGKNKAYVVGELIREINPEIELEVYEEGITENNVEEFVDGADLVVDETEFTLHAIGVALARQARHKNIPNLMAFNLGFGTTVTTYQPKGSTLEKTLGLSETATLEEIAEQKVPLSRWLPYLPKYGDIEVLSKVESGEKPAPSIAPGVALAAGVAATQATLNLLQGQNKRSKPVYAPDALVMDALAGEVKIVRYHPLSHYRTLATLIARNTLRLNPKAGY